MSIHGILGEHTTDYPTQYDPSLLYPIARSLGRDVIGGDATRLAQGVDWWHAFELSWLDARGISQVAMARLAIPADSPSIIESKSLKLYFNSLNFTVFESWDAISAQITEDLSECLQAAVEVSLFALGEMPESLQISAPTGVCIDEALADSTDKVALCAHPDASLLQAAGEMTDSNEAQLLYCNLLRSNCPVTNQPDWGTLQVHIVSAKKVDTAALLRYVLSFRQHNGFHEQCVEQIFADLSAFYAPTELMVRAWYTRRGGIDINPCRVSDSRLLPAPSRLIRQ